MSITRTVAARMSWTTSEDLPVSLTDHISQIYDWPSVQF